MAISIGYWTCVCPPATHSSLCFTLPGSHRFPPLGSSLQSTSCRCPPATSHSRHGSKRCGATVVQFDTADGRPSGRNQSMVGDVERLSSALQVGPSVTRSILAARMHPRLTIPCLVMRGGTSRGTYFLKQHLPVEREALDKVLLRVLGSPHPIQIDGLGGTNSVTSKVAIISRSKEPGVDVDYTFAQVSVDKAHVDWEPSCGNILAGVGPAAIEMGLVPEIGDPVTVVSIRATNNGALVESIVQTPNQTVEYDGDAAIDGVPGTAAPITLNLMDVVGPELLPTGQLRDVINGVEVTCIDVAMPVVLAKASSFGKTGYENPEELDEDRAFFRMEDIRVIAGKKMGLGDVSGRVIPKFIIVAESRSPKGNITARYFVPDKTHAAMAVTGAICISCCSILRGSIAEEVATNLTSIIGRTRNEVVIEHPSGSILIVLDSEQQAGVTSPMIVHRAGVLRTARLIFEGTVHVKGEGFEKFALHDELLEGVDRYQQYHRRLQQNFRKLYKFEGSDLDAQCWEGDDNLAESNTFVEALRPSMNDATLGK